MLQRFSLLLFLLPLSCAVSQKRVETLSEQTFERTKQRYLIEEDKKENSYVQCIVNALNKSLPTPQSWEVVIFKNEEANAFALPGGKIGVNSGLFRAALNSDQLAAVIGHEMGHVIAEHGRDRMEKQSTLNALNVVSTIALRGSGAGSAIASGLIGGAQLGILYPYSQTQESEADVIGLHITAKAGFDPSQTIDFWRNMETLGVLTPTNKLSGHPAIEQRIQKLQSHMKEALALQSDKEPAKCVR